MDVLDSMFISNRDWDPGYLMDIFSHDFFEFQDLWSSQMSDNELVKEVQNVEKYQPIVEDISMDDDLLCSAVEKIEEE